MKKTFFLLLLCFVCENLVANYRTFRQSSPSIEYGVIEANPADVKLHWKNAQGVPYKSLTRLKNALEANNQQIIMLMNAGIYDKNHQPAGLWVEKGKILKPLNRHKGKGNFHIQPNGVLFIQHNKAQILATQAYQQQKITPQWALQSGPMLIINGKINRQFRPTLESPHKRNAVCLTKNHRLYFVMTLQGEPNMYYFAQGLAQLGCYNALYLDGSISNWYIPKQFNSFHWHEFVGMISVSQKN